MKESLKRSPFRVHVSFASPHFFFDLRFPLFCLLFLETNSPFTSRRDCIPLDFCCCSRIFSFSFTHRGYKASLALFFFAICQVVDTSRFSFQETLDRQEGEGCVINVVSSGSVKDNRHRKNERISMVKEEECPESEQKVEKDRQRSPFLE